MAGQGPSRRELLEALGLASAASVFRGFSRWNYAFSEKPPQHANTRSAHAPVHPVYQPQFFAPDQYRTVEVLADLILPVTHTSGHKKQPGAKEAGVAEFIDFMVFSDVALQALFRDGLVWLDQVSTPASSFQKLTPAEQTAVLTRLAYKAKYRDDEKPGQQFFRLVRKYTVTGFYTTRIGLQALDFPGLTFYGTSPGCTHEGNPEHAGL
jgi:gluconate 2-dehydrogenase gamma chain